MKIYAIIDKETNIVLNVVNVENENFLFSNPETEYTALANRAVQIGMIYDKKTSKFPEAGDKGELMDLKDEIQSLISAHTDLITQHSYLTTEQLQVHLDYVNQLIEVSSKSSYVDMKVQFDELKPAPEFPPAPKEITQDVFRDILKLSEKVLWDNPETGTTQQIAAINTLKIDFPFYGVENMTEELALLQQVEFLTATRVKEIKAALA